MIYYSYFSLLTSHFSLLITAQPLQSRQSCRAWTGLGWLTGISLVYSPAGCWAINYRTAAGPPFLWWLEQLLLLNSRSNKLCLLLKTFYGRISLTQQIKWHAGLTVLIVWWLRSRVRGSVDVLFLMLCTRCVPAGHLPEYKYQPLKCNWQNCLKENRRILSEGSQFQQQSRGKRIVL